MAYIPPHKRHSKGLERRPTPTTPELFVPQFKRSINHNNAGSSRKNIYADGDISIWFAVDLDGYHQFPSTLQLEPISLESTGKKPLILVKSHKAKEDDDGVRINIMQNPWNYIAEKVWPDLLSSFEIVRKKMKLQELEEVKPTLVARFGKILFNRPPSIGEESVREVQVAEYTLRQLKRSFYTNIPTSYIEKTITRAVPKIGADFEEEKDIYHVKLSDRTRKDSTLSCKCSVKDNNKLEMYKVELNQVRNMVVDISCLDKNLDLRLALCSKRILTALTDDELHSIRKLIDSAVLDPEVKGGLRWPLVKENSSDRYRVVGVWHTIAKAFKSPSLRLKVRHADRFDFRTSTGEAKMEIILKLKRIVSDLQERKVEIDTVYNMFEDNLKLIWEHFLCCEQYLR